MNYIFSVKVKVLDSAFKKTGKISKSNKYPCHAEKKRGYTTPLSVDIKQESERRHLLIAGTRNKQLPFL